MIDKRCERGPLLSLFQILCGAGCANRYTHIRGWREGRMEGRREGGIEGQKCRHEHAMILAVPTTQGKKTRETAPRHHRKYFKASCSTQV